jgi:hypothetical protein
MKIRAKSIKKALECVPDDAEIWIEYPERYGLSQPETIVTKWPDTYDETDLIECMSYAFDEKENKFYILHHL